MMSGHTKMGFDLASVATIVGTMADQLPRVAALLSVIWGVLRLWEMWTGKTIAERRGKNRPVADERRKG
jgi:hypothetical protein